MRLSSARRRFGLAKVSLAFALLMTLGLLPGASHSAGAVTIDVLSNRADLVSGGDALVRISTADLTGLAVDLNGSDVTGNFAVRPNGNLEGLLTGMPNGANTLTATLPGGSGARITITNHPIGGPVFSGPLVQPWVCQTGALDASCNAPITYQFMYVPAVSAAPSVNVAGFTVGAGFQSYDPNNPPPDGTVATTTTDQGKTVPYIIRVETGYELRDQYQIAVLYDPAKPWAPWAPQAGWNHKVLITHGASCGIDHKTGTAPSVTDDVALSRGFAVMSTALDNAGHNCNVATEAESLIMAKEHLVETYGEIRYTIGTGCSGGSLVQHQVANAYPGVYQGILPQCSFADAWSTGIQTEDYQLLRNYYENPAKWGPGIAWDPKAIGDVEGHPNYVNGVLLSSYTSLFNPTAACAGVTSAQQYNAKTNPHGVRCTGQDYQINVFGPRPQDGFAGRPLDNTGVQYGLAALMNGSITPAQFVDVNTRIGSHDIDYNPVPGRAAADEPALANAYRSGAVNEANNLGSVAIIDLRGTDPGAFHDVFRAFAVRSRLERSNGTYANQVIWEGPVPLLGQADYTTLGLIAIDRWLAVVEADHRDVPVSQKVIEDKPADIHDQCTDGLGHAIPDERTCHTINPMFTTPRIVAGEPFTDDVEKCSLRPINRHDYFPIEFTDAEWTALKGAYPTGVCDFSEPGVSQQPTIPWMTYQDAAGNVIYGGTPLGAPPVSQAF